MWVQQVGDAKHAKNILQPLDMRRATAYVSELSVHNQALQPLT